MTNDKKTRQRVVIENSEIRVEIIERSVPTWKYKMSMRDYNSDWREYRQAPRMYVSANIGESVLENLANRTRRPYTLWKKMIPGALSRAGISLSLEGWRWSRNAGCTMCPCSPGFIIPTQTIGVTPGREPVRNFDVWVTLKGAPSIDERKPARVI